VPVRHDHAAAREVRHEMRGHEVAGPVEARLALARVQLTQAAADRDVRADDEHRVREAPVGAVGDLVEDAPGGEHPHDRGLAAARRHLARQTLEGAKPFGLALVARFVERDRDPLTDLLSALFS
jgi:hypothetical protein